MKEVIAITRGFHGHLIEAGERFMIGDDEDMGEWMRPVDSKGLPVETKKAVAEAKKTGAPLASAPFNVPEQVYKVKHNGGGDFIVVDGEGNKVGEPFLFNKDDKQQAKSLAQAEADRMNVSPIQPGAAPTISPQQAAQIPQSIVEATHDTMPDADIDDDGHPDA